MHPEIVLWDRDLVDASTVGSLCEEHKRYPSRSQIKGQGVVAWNQHHTQILHYPESHSVFLFKHTWSHWEAQVKLLGTSDFENAAKDSKRGEGSRQK